MIILLFYFVLLLCMLPLMANSHLRRWQDSTQLNCWLESRQRRSCELAITI